MGDEDWEAEIITPHLSSYVPVFEKVATLDFQGPKGAGRTQLGCQVNSCYALSDWACFPQTGL